MSGTIETYAEHVSARVQPEEPLFNPAYIVIIIEVILQVIECLRERQRFVTVAKNPTLLQRVALRRQVRECMRVSGWHHTAKDVADMTEALLDESAEMSAEVLHEVFREGAEVMGL